MKAGNIPRLAIAIIICEAVGIVSSLFTISSISTWYAALAKPSFTPPGWLFGPVWTILYFLMGVAVYLVYEKGIKKGSVRGAIGIFALQLALNFLWTAAFFGLRSISFGFAIIILLWLAIAATIIAFYRVRKSAAWLLIPYIAWVTIAMALNYLILVLNP